MQQLLATVIVLACAAYAAWSLGPAAARNWLRRVVLHRPPAATEGCSACSGCATPKPRGRTPARVVRRAKR